MRARLLVLLSLVVGGAMTRWGQSRSRAPPLPWRQWRDVTTTQGVVRGYQAPQYFAFLGVPYAKPPLHNNRFKAPEPAAPWEGVFEATYRVLCPQPSVDGDENCLVVNIFVTQSAPDGLQPVLVLLHNGGFHTGWGELRPPIRFLDDFVVVSINYRLGAFGFLCLGIPEAPGNAGLKDQIAALYWLRQNIANFGGNRDDVTVYGIGAGAVSAQLLLLSGLARGLIHKAILDSGSILSPTSMTYDPFATALNIAISLGYEDNGSTDKLLEFYRKLPVNDLVNISTNFSPCVENSVLYAHSMLDQDPREILMKGEFTKIPLMMIYTASQEVQLVEQNYDKFTVIPEIFEYVLPNNLEFDDDSIKMKIAELVKHFYFDQYGRQENEKTVQSYKEYINDIFMEYPVYKFSLLYAEKTSIPVYIMRFAPDEGVAQDTVGEYGEVYRYILAKDLPDEQVIIANKLVSLFKNFMKISDPTPLTTEIVPLIWEPLNPHGLPSLSIDRPCLLFSSSLTMGQPPASQRINFWDYIYTQFYRKLTFTELKE